MPEEKGILVFRPLPFPRSSWNLKILYNIFFKDFFVDLRLGVDLGFIGVDGDSLVAVEDGTDDEDGSDEEGGLKIYQAVERK